MNNRGRGFTLVEVAIVLFIVSLLFGATVSVVGSHRGQASHGETDKLLKTAVDALSGYVAANGRFPCPSLLGGTEEEAPLGGGPCTFQGGFLPGRTLGLLPIDGWDRPLRYAVATRYQSCSDDDEDGVCNDPPASIYANDASTTVDALLLGMSDLRTDVSVCNGGTRNSYVVLGLIVAPCTVEQPIIGNALVAVVWSDGPDAFTDGDNIVLWNALPITTLIMRTARS